MAAIASPIESIQSVIDNLSFIQEAHIEGPAFRGKYSIRFGDGEGPFEKKTVSVFLRTVQPTLNRLADCALTLSIKQRKIVLKFCNTIEQAFKEAITKEIHLPIPPLGKELFCKFPVEHPWDQIEGAQLKCIQTPDQKIDFIELPLERVLEMPD